VLQDAGLDVQLLHKQHDDGLRIIIDVGEQRSQGRRLSEKSLQKKRLRWQKRGK